MSQGKLRVSPRAHLLGDQTAESDRLLLGNFFETPEYRSLIENDDHTVVVGRRGTGKSALFTKLGEFWNSQKSLHVIPIRPEDYHTIGFRVLFTPLGGKYNYVRAASKIIWKYGLILEATVELCKGFKGRESIAKLPTLFKHYEAWQVNQSDFFNKLIKIGHDHLIDKVSVELNIANLNSTLSLSRLEDEFKELSDYCSGKVYILIDKLDEGYENDDTGAAIVSGAIHAVSELNKKFEKLRPVLFQRDNIHRIIAKLDPDYTRNIEGEILRLHWSTHQLLNLVAKRLNSVFNLGLENSQKIWDRCTSDTGTGQELKGQSGFEKCLQFTLYRPRDLVTLLNSAFFIAAKDGRTIITLADIENTAKSISQSRFDDLKKEYKPIFPSIVPAVHLFANGSPELSYSDALGVIDLIPTKGEIWMDDSSALIDYQLLGSMDVLRSLYSVGFLGIHDSTTNAFIFCHDGRSPDREMAPDDKLLVHPCYWMALNLSKNALRPDEAAMINDEYDIVVKSMAPEIRKQKLGTLIADLGIIPEGTEGAIQYEGWVLKSVQTIFAGHLENIVQKPNGANVQRRDIVATNHAKSSAWTRIRDDYSVRQVIFEVKNFSDIGPEEYRQMASYLVDQYGRLGFIITRDKDESLRSGKDLDWAKEIFNTQKKVIVKLSYKFFTRLLGKLRNPEKHDAVNQALNHLLDDYERRFLSNQTSLQHPTRKQKKTGRHR